MVMSPPCAVKRWVSSGLRAAGRDHLAALHQGRGHRDRLVEQAAGIVAEVDDVAGELVLRDLLLDIADRLAQPFGGLLVERADPDIADVAALDVILHRTDADDLARNRDLDRLVGVLADDLQPDRAVGRALHLVDGLVERHALDLVIVDRGDHVARHDAGARGRRVVDRRHHLDEAVLHGDLDAEPAELAMRGLLHLRPALLVHVAGVRVERGDHAVDRALDELGVLGLLDVVGLDLLEHLAEQVELRIGVAVVGMRGGVGDGEQMRALRRGHEQGETRARDRPEQKANMFAHYP
ncbi:hypothetical protein ACVWY5_003683 [Bradyrhizobium sp. USDA 3256]